MDKHLLEQCLGLCNSVSRKDSWEKYQGVLCEGRGKGAQSKSLGFPALRSSSVLSVTNTEEQTEDPTATQEEVGIRKSPLLVLINCFL